MARQQPNQLRSGVVLSYLNLIVSSLIPFLYTPLMLELLGQAEYGLYSLANSVISYLSLLSLGFGSTIIRYIVKYRTEQNQDMLERVYGFFLAFYCTMALVVLLCGIFISCHVNTVFRQGLTHAEIDTMKKLVLILTVNSALSFPASVFTSMAIANERYIFRKIMDLLSTVAIPIVNLIALYLGYASVGMAVAGTVFHLSMMPVNIYYCHVRLHVRPRFQRLPAQLVKEMMGVSFFHFVGAIVDMLFWATDKVILGMLTNSVMVAIYNVGATFNNILISLSSSISGVLTPKITGMVISRSPKKEQTALFIRIGRLQFIVVALVLTGYAAFGRVFLDLWVGESYSDAFWVALLTMFPLCIPLIQNTGLSIVVAQNKHQFRAVVYLIIAIANVISTYLIVPYMGIIGAALCSCVSYLLGQGIIMNIYYYKVTGLDIPRFWGNILRMSIIPGLMLIAGLFVLEHVVLDSWMTFFVGVVIYTGLYALLMYRFAMNDYEKDIIRKPLRKILNRFRR